MATTQQQCTRVSGPAERRAPGNERLKLKHACLSACRVLEDESADPHRRIQIALEHLRAVL